MNCHSGKETYNSAMPKEIRKASYLLKWSASSRLLYLNFKFYRFPKQCKFSEYDCEMELMLPELQIHEKECQYRLVRKIWLDF